MAMRHDEAFKFLFDLPAVCANMLRVAAPELWPQLDPHSVRNLRVGDTVTADLTRRTGDALCRVDLRNAKLPDRRSAYLVVPVEFQSGHDQDMAERMGEYVARQLDTLRRQGSIPPTTRRPCCRWSSTTATPRGPRRMGWSRCALCPPMRSPTSRRTNRRRT